MRFMEKPSRISRQSLAAFIHILLAGHQNVAAYSMAKKSLPFQNGSFNELLSSAYYVRGHSPFVSCDWFWSLAFPYSMLEILKRPVPGSGAYRTIITKAGQQNILQKHRSKIKPQVNISREMIHVAKAQLKECKCMTKSISDTEN